MASPTASAGAADASALAEACRDLDFDVRGATEEQTHVYVVFETGEISVTKCGRGGWMFGDRSLVVVSPPIVARPARIGMPRTWDGHRCTVLGTEAEAERLRERIRLFNADASA